MNFHSRYPSGMICLLITALLVRLIAANREEARVSLVGPSTVLTELHFTNEVKRDQTSGFTNLGTFPSIIHELGKWAKSGTISFTRGVWDDSLWSHPTFSTKPHGFDLELEGLDKASFPQVIKMISGYFCASASRMKIEQIYSKDSIIWGNLPQEALCVENLRPFLNLLPSRGVSGLASMILSEVIHRSEYYSMQVSFESSESLCSVKASIFLVNDLNRWDRKGKYSLPTVLGKIPYAPSGTLNLFGKVINLAETENIDYTLPVEIPLPRAVRIYSFKTGTGDDEAGFGYVMENVSDQPVDVRVLQPFPWMFRPLWHQTSKIPELKSLAIRPAKFDRKSSSFAEFAFSIPARSQIRFHVPLEREFLKIDEFPTNSERGIDFHAAKVTINQSTFATNSLLYTWPIPDATMPFGVITMSSTVMALFYGAFFNMIFRRFYLRRPEDPPASPIGRILWKLKEKLQQFKARK